jgi:hypothetical protein
MFFLLLFAIIDFGRYVYYVQVLNNAAREGARYAIVHGSKGIPTTGPSPNDPAITSVVRSYAVGVIGSGTYIVGSTWGDPSNPTPSNTRGQIVHVSVTYDFHSLIPIVPIPPITITGESTLVINN